MSVAPSAGRIIDHVVILVADLDAARDALAALGFTVLPRGGHPIFGTANHTIMFDDSYIELLSIAVPGTVNQYQQDYIAAGGGLLGLSLATPDADGTAARLARQGIDATAPMDFERPVDTSAGRLSAQFRTLHLSASLGFAGYGFFCAHLTPEVVWLPDRPAHPNGATTISGVTMKALPILPRHALAEVAEPGATGPMPLIGDRPILAINVARAPDHHAARAAGFSSSQGARGIALHHPALGEVELVLVLS